MSEGKRSGVVRLVLAGIAVAMLVGGILLMKKSSNSRPNNVRQTSVPISDRIAKQYFVEAQDEMSQGVPVTLVSRHLMEKLKRHGDVPSEWGGSMGRYLKAIQDMGSTLETAFDEFNETWSGELNALLDRNSKDNFMGGVAEAGPHVRKMEKCLTRLDYRLDFTLTNVESALNECERTMGADWGDAHDAIGFIREQYAKITDVRRRQIEVVREIVSKSSLSRERLLELCARYDQLDEQISCIALDLDRKKKERMSR